MANRLAPPILLFREEGPANLHQSQYLATFLIFEPRLYFYTAQGGIQSSVR